MPKQYVHFLITFSYFSAIPNRDILSPTEAQALPSFIWWGTSEKLLGLHIDNYKQLFFCKGAEALVLKLPVTDREAKQLYHSQYEGIVLYLKFILLFPNTRINN